MSRAASRAAPGCLARRAAIESNFSDPTTVIVSLSFANMGSGVLGATGSSYVDSYSDARNGLINGMDGDDTRASCLPGPPSPCALQREPNTVTNETRVFFTRANYKATIGRLGRLHDASMR